MNFSILICTHNRKGALTRTLASLSRLEVPAEVSVEVVVIDNASNDGTAEMLEKWDDAALPLRSVREERLGLVYARNRALSEAQGDVLLFLDDDVTVSSGLLREYGRAVNEQPAYDFFGGPIIPMFESPPSDLALLLLRERPYVFAGLDLGPTARPLSAHEGPYGANMLVRRKSIGEAKFHPDLSYVGRGGTAGDETWFFLQVERGGGRGYWVPSATVQHWIPAPRTTWAAAKRFAVASTRAGVRIEGMGTAPPANLNLRTLAWYARRAIVLQSAALLAQWMRAPLATQLDRRYRVWQTTAELGELWDRWLASMALTPRNFDT